ncbi:hypothetical protein C8Q72DRAFT_549177 [Fomitopsis betulina]|nr:hypothetical protein C8Q72DRAFT_549177 [Fomitopsis betulina]
MGSVDGSGERVDSVWAGGVWVAARRWDGWERRYGRRGEDEEGKGRGGGRRGAEQGSPASTEHNRTWSRLPRSGSPSRRGLGARRHPPAPLLPTSVIRRRSGVSLPQRRVPDSRTSFGRRATILRLQCSQSGRCHSPLHSASRSNHLRTLLHDSIPACSPWRAGLPLRTPASPRHRHVCITKSPSSEVHAQVFRTPGPHLPIVVTEHPISSNLYCAAARATEPQGSTARP